MTTRPARTIVAIDLLRFACAMLVVAHHYAARLPILSIGRPAGPPLDWAAWGWAGWVGVEIFFVISGYVIACSALSGEAADFLRRRALRLVPGAWICATITAATMILTGTEPASLIMPQWVNAMTFWPIGKPVDGTYWTLGIEIAFYLLVAIRLKSDGRAREIERIGMALAIVSAGYWSWAAVAGPWQNRAADLLLLSYGGTFACGIALWGVRQSGPSAMRLAMLALGTATSIAEIRATCAVMATGTGVEPGAVVPIALFLGAVAIIALAGRVQPAIERIIRPRAAGFIGMMTYPLYLIHQRIGEMLIVDLIAAGVPWRLAIIGTAMLAVAGAAAITALMEPPLRRWISQNLNARRGRASDNRRTAFP